MKRSNALTRRTFLKTSLAGATTLGTGPMIFLPRLADPVAEGGFSYHPNLDPLRVVGIHDPTMTKEENPTAPWKVQEGLLHGDRIEENLDRLACVLAEEAKVTEAWRKIFVKPAAKAWSEVRVAVKTNNIAEQHTRSPVLGKICRVLTREMGVRPGNIAIYDACHGRDMREKTPFAGLPPDCRIESAWGGFSGKTRIPRPWKEGEGEAECLAPLARGEVDILVNIALCKGHGGTFGKFTMCMKNHFGTFNPRPHGHAPGATDYLIAINKSPLLLGEVDPKRRKTDRPVQQLCLVDALWASEPGPGGNPTVQPNRLYMGAFGPAVDYLLAHRFRKEAMGWEINEEVTGRFLTDFGFAPADLPNEGGIVDAGAV